jgi:hypothetical protein
MRTIDILKEIEQRIKKDFAQFHSRVSEDFDLGQTSVRIGSTALLTQYQLLDCDLTYSFPKCQEDDDHISLTIGFFQKREIDSPGWVTYTNKLAFSGEDVLIGDRLYITAGVFSALGQPLVEIDDMELVNPDPNQLLDEVELALQKIFLEFTSQVHFLRGILRERQNCA